MYRMGCMYLHGIGTETDEREAEKYLLKAEEYGNTHAAYQLAKLYIRQQEEKREAEPEQAVDSEKIRKAVTWLTEAAGQGNAFAGYALGKLYGDGKLIAKDMEKAFFYLNQAADAGNVYAQYWLGRWYLMPEYYDIEKAIHYLTQGVEQNSDLAAYRLGKVYLAGEDVPKNVELAVRFLEQSADAGNQYARYVLGKLYLIGKDVPQNKEKAYEYFKLAAEQGNVYAAYFLEHWNDMPHPDLFLMATRLMHHLKRVIEDDVSGRRRGSRGGTDHKLARKIKAKKIAQGHAEDDKEEMVQTQ